MRSIVLTLTDFNSSKPRKLFRALRIGPGFRETSISGANEASCEEEDSNAFEAQADSIALRKERGTGPTPGLG